MQEIHWYTHNKRREERPREIQPCGKGREIPGYTQDPVISIVQAAHRHNPYGKGDKGYRHRPNHMVGMQGPVNGASRDPHPAGRQVPDGQAETLTQRAETLTH